MKIFLPIIAFFLFTSQLAAQGTGKITNLKDAWDLSYTYVGEIRNGKPNGKGIAIYTTGNVKRYAGNFLNGWYSGNGTMFFTNGAFLTGNWLNGKLNGKAADFNEKGALYVGEYGKGQRNGKGVLIYQDNGFSKGTFVNDQLNGRVTYLWNHGATIADNMYKDGKQNGTGYQYEAKTKTIFEGEWQDDKWLKATTASFTSFLRHKDFISEYNAQHVLMGPVTDKGMLKDTAYYYDLEKHKRYFGLFVNGNLRDGIIIRDDSTRFIGRLDENGATGDCVFFKVGKYYSQGNYTNDQLNGYVTDIDPEKQTVYFGDAKNGYFTGKAHYINDKNTQYVGDYVDGKFTGYGYKLESSGIMTTGTWNDGLVQKLTSIVTADKDLVTATPKTFAEALNNIAKIYSVDGYFDLFGTYAKKEEMQDFETKEISYLDYSTSLMRFPESIGTDYIGDDYEGNSLYISKFIATTDSKKAIAKYNQLAKQLQSLTITNNKIKTAVKLTGTINPADPSKEETVTEFSLPESAIGYSNFKVWLGLHKDASTGNYTVYLKIGQLSDAMF